MEGLWRGVIIVAEVGIGPPINYTFLFLLLMKQNIKKWIIEDNILLQAFAF